VYGIFIYKSMVYKFCSFLNSVLVTAKYIYIVLLKEILYFTLIKKEYK